MNDNCEKKLVSRTFRLNCEMANRLALEATMRRVSGEEPDSQQGILEEALGLWFNVRGLTEPAVETTIKVE